MSMLSRLSLLLALGLAACGTNTAQGVKKDIEKGGEVVGEALHKGGEVVGGAIQKGGEAVGDTLKKGGDAVQKVVN